jgi:uncharacterized protein
MQSLIEQHKTIIMRTAAVLAALLGIFLIIASARGLKEYRYVGAGLPAGSTISVNGTAELEKSPDTAKFSFTVQAKNKVVATAQEEVSKKVAKVTADLIAAGIEEKYITTNTYNSYPEYDYSRVMCAPGMGCPSSPVLSGYTVSQSVQVSVKDLGKAEVVAGILGAGGVTSIDGPNFGFEDDTAIAREARDLAIMDAKEEAEKLAASLGVKLVRVVSFSEGSTNMPMYARAESFDAKGGAGNAAPTLPTGVQKINASVTVVYEIR